MKKLKAINAPRKKISFYSTRFGDLAYFEDDIYVFDDGLSGFKQHNCFIRTNLPQMPHHDAFGLLHSMRDENLSFILFYPTLTMQQKSLLLQKVKTILKVSIHYAQQLDHFTSADLTVAFLVILKEAQGETEVRCVEEAPLVFLEPLKKAWQIVLS